VSTIKAPIRLDDVCRPLRARGRYRLAPAERARRTAQIARARGRRKWPPEWARDGHLTVHDAAEQLNASRAERGLPAPLPVVTIR
jgi:hypothetical protein